MATEKSNEEENARRRKGNGTLELRGDTYIARWRYNGKRYARSTGTGELEEAKKKLAEFMFPYTHDLQLNLLEAQLHKIKNEEPQAKEKLRKDLIANGFTLYLEAASRPDASAATLTGYKGQYRIFLEWMKLKHPGVKFLQDVTEDHAQGFMQYLAAKLSPNSYNKYATFLKCLWRTLRHTCRLDANPWEDIRHKRLTTHSRRELTLEELQRVLETAEGEMKILFTIGIYTGLRLGDCALLDWECVNLKEKLIKLVPRKTARHANGKLTVIPIHEALAEVLGQVPVKERKGFVLPDTAQAYKKSPSLLTHYIQKHFRTCGIQTGAKTARLYKKRGTYRFEFYQLNEKGQHIIEDTKLTDLKEAQALFAKRFGTSKRDRVDVGFHSLRHTWVSLAANSGAPLALVQAIVGHSNPTMTRHYFHENVDALRSTVAKLPTITSTPESESSALSSPDFSFLKNYSIADLKALEAEINRRLLELRR